MNDEAKPKPSKTARRPSADRRPASITVVDVARVAGVSAITVSRALNTPEQLSPATLERVRAAIRETGYVPNLLAGGLRSSKSRLVAAVVPTIASPVFMETIQSLTEALAERGYQLILGQSGYADSREDALLDALVGRRPDGIVLTGLLRSTEGRRRLLASGIPVVETWDLSDNPIDMLVGFSHEDIGAAVCRFLHRKGRRRPVLLSGDDERAQRRNAGFRAAAVDLGLCWDEREGVPTRLVPAPTTLASGRRVTGELLQSHPGFDAVFCSSDLLALGVLTEAQARTRVVPQDFAVIGFGDQHYAAALHPALTTVRIDGTAIGRQAARFIVERAEGRTVEARIVDVGYSIVERDSV